MVEQLKDSLKVKELDLSASKKMWDRRAEEFSKISIPKKDVSLEFIKEHMDLAGKSVIDIGFGAGRYLLPLAKEKMEIYGVELSENMYKLACKSLDEAGVEYNKEKLINAPWEDIDIYKLNWEKKFDLAFLSMSPAISSFEELEKVMRIAKKGIFLSSHMVREDELLKELGEELGKKENTEYIGKINIISNILFEMGYFPDVKYVKMERGIELNIDDCLERYSHWLFGNDPKEEDFAKVKAALEKRSKDGKINSNMREINGYMFVDLDKTFKSETR